MANNTLLSIVDFATNTGRLSFEAWGDSTVERSGGGHSVGFAKGLFGLVLCAGQMVPPNTTAPFDYTAGLVESRRRNNATTKLGVEQSADRILPGYLATFKQYGSNISTLGVGGGASTLNGAINASVTTITLASATSFSSSGAVLIDQEYITYASKNATQLLTCVRGTTNSSSLMPSLAASHLDTAVVKEVSIFCGPQTAHMGGTMLNGAIADGVSTADITVDDTSAFQFQSGQTRRIKIDSEILAYTGVTATTFTGISRAQLGTTGAAHADNAVVGQCDNGVALSGMFSMARHPIGSGASFVASAFYMTSTAFDGTVPGTIKLAFDTTNTFVNTDVTYTNKVAGAAAALNGSFTIGTIHRTDAAYTGADLTNTTQVTLNAGSATGNGVGPAGPAALMYLGLFEANRPKGAIQSEGISQGGKTLNFLLRSLRLYDATNTVCEFDAGLLTRHKIMGGDTTVGIAATALGGNTVAGWCQVTCTGHNETSDSIVETALVDSAESWTIKTTTSLDAAIADATTTAAITLQPGVVATLPTAGHILCGTERIIYTGVSGETLTGITRGAYGTVGAAHADDAPVYQGYLLQNPKGFCTDLLFDYKLKRASWIAAGGSASYFWYVWVRPIPVSATSTAVADDTAISGTQAQQYAQKEYKFNQFVQTANAYLGTRDGFVVADMSTVYAGADALTYDLGVLPGAAGDQVHNSNATYEQAWHRMFASAGFRPGTGAIPSTGPTVGSGGVAYRGRNRGQGNF